MVIDDKIRDEKLQYDINREATKISALSSRKNDKDEYLSGDKILTFDQRRVIEEAKFTHFSPGKAFENKQKRLKSKEEKKIDAIMNRMDRLVASTNKDDHKDNYKEIFKVLFK